MVAASDTEFTLGHNVFSQEEVDAVMEQARKAGAVIVKPAHETFWGGYAGYFEDPDRHLWEVVWNPQLKIQEENTTGLSLCTHPPSLNWTVGRFPRS